uniref:Fanconi anemia group B protein n=1 Tax=Denticeps clupeoides TaxID=299321 RepID=A0AAY4DNN5_9TELE
MHGHQRLIAFNNDLLLFTSRELKQEGKRKSQTELVCRRLSFVKDTNRFITRDAALPAVFESVSPSAAVAFCSAALDVRRRIVVPCVLLKQWERRLSSFQYTLLTLTGSGKAEVRVKFTSPYELRDDVTILQGPTVVWSHKNVVHYASSLADEVRCIPELLSVHYVGELPLAESKLIVLGSQRPTKEEQGGQSDVAGEGKMLGYFIDCGKVFDGTRILPSAYSSVVRCALVVSAEEVNNNLKTAVVAATSKKQLVLFENGVPTEICQLPHEEPESIEMVNTGNSGLVFVVLFKHGDVCAVWKDTFQVAASWTGVRSLHVDDFVGCGTDQMLLVFRDQSPDDCPLKEFLITDLCGITFSSENENHVVSGACDSAGEDFHLTIQALESRLQSGLTMLHDLQTDAELKERVLLQSTKALEDMVSGREHFVSKTEQEGLVSLLDEEEEEEEEQVEDASDEKMGSGGAPFHVEKVWQRVVEDHLIVGVLLSLLTEEGLAATPAVIQTRSTALRIPVAQSLSQPEPEVKRKRTDGAAGGNAALRLLLTAVTEVTPLLTPRGVKCLVMLHYVPKEASYGSSAGPAASRLLQCGRVSLSIQDVAQGLFQPRLLKSSQDLTDECREDLFSLLALWNSWCLQISSPEHTLCDVGGWLRQAMKCDAVEVDPQYLLSRAAGLPAAMLFCWKQSTPFKGVLDIHCRDRFTFLLFLHSLCGFLPASCQVQPFGKGERSANPGLDLSHSLETELVVLREGLSSLLSDDAEGRRERERSKRRLSPPVEMERYHQLIQAVLGTDHPLVAEAELHM